MTELYVRTRMLGSPGQQIQHHFLFKFITSRHCALDGHYDLDNKKA
jgi:hypothetical protein